MAEKKKYTVTKRETTTTTWEVEAWNPTHAKEMENAKPLSEPKVEMSVRATLVKPPGTEEPDPVEDEVIGKRHRKKGE